MRNLTYIDLLPRTRDFCEELSAIACLTNEVEELLPLLGGGTIRRIESWPSKPGPGGAVQFTNGRRAHGAYASGAGDHVELIVANGGWPIERYRCPGPIPPSSPALSAINYWVSQQPSLWVAQGKLGCIDPGTAAVGRVLHGCKPLALADTTDQAMARCWKAMAEEAGLGVRVVQQHEAYLAGGAPVFFVSVARPERFDSLIDLDRLTRWYRVALDAAGASAVFPRVATSLADLARQSPTDFLDRTDDLVMAPFGDLVGEGCFTEVTGAVLGYWPPTTAALIATTAADELGCSRYRSQRFPEWDQLRLRTVDRVLGSLDEPAC